MPRQLTIEWAEATRVESTVDLQSLFETYFSADATIRRVVVKPLSAGRSGALVFVAQIWGDRTGTLTPLQPEFLKVLVQRDFDNEVGAFENLFNGTAVIFGQTLARPPVLGRDRTVGVFGYKLFEAGDRLDSLFAVTAAAPELATRAVGLFLQGQLMPWYGPPAMPSDSVPMPIAQERLDELQTILDGLDARVGNAVGSALRAVRQINRPGVLSKIHGDLHLENFLVARGGERIYLIDFGSAKPSGSPCIDLARLETDTLHRTSSWELDADHIAAMEKALWDADAEVPRASTNCWRLICAIRGACSPWLQTENGLLWYLVGRLVHSMRMLSGTWPDIPPYGQPTRRAGIVTSLGVLAERVQRVLSGHTRTFRDLPPPEAAYGQPDALLSLRWAFINRRYRDAHELARKAYPVGASHSTEFGLWTALSGMSDSPVPRADLSVLARSSGRVRTPFQSGLKRLVEGLGEMDRTDGPRPRRASALFREALDAFERSEAHDFCGVAEDMQARALMKEGDVEAAKVSFTNAIEHKRRSSDRVGLATSLGGLGRLHLQTFEYEDAVACFNEDIRIVLDLGDDRVRVKLLNWLAQALALQDAQNLYTALWNLAQSSALSRTVAEPGYTSGLDEAFSEVENGFVFIGLDSPNRASESEARARMLFESTTGREKAFGLAVCEILSGGILIMGGAAVSGPIRVKGGLDAILAGASLLDYLYQGVRASRMLRLLGENATASAVATSLSSRVRRLRTSHRVARILARLSAGNGDDGIV